MSRPILSISNFFVDIRLFTCYYQYVNREVITLNERIKKLRKALNLTQQEFADRLKVSRSNIATYEVGKNNPADAVVNLICREFGVSEEWLRTGEGDMFAPKTDEDELTRAVESMLKGRNPNFKRRMVSILAGLGDNEWTLLEEKMLELAKAADLDTTGHERTEADTGGQERAQSDVAARVEELERQNKELAAKVAAMEEEDAKMEAAAELSLGKPFSGGTKTG